MLADDRIDILTVDMGLRSDVDANINTLAGDVTYASDDRTLLAKFCAKAYDSDAIKAMKMDRLRTQIMRHVVKLDAVVVDVLQS